MPPTTSLNAAALSDADVPPGSGDFSVRMAAIAALLLPLRIVLALE